MLDHSNGYETPIHIWTLGPILATIEQCRFIIEAFSQAGYKNISISRHFNPCALNIIIEGIQPNHILEVMSKSTYYNKKVALILTEHIDVIEGKTFFYGINMNDKYDDRFKSYMPNKKAVKDRLKFLHYLMPFTTCCFKLGHLPRLQNIDILLGDIPIWMMPYPKLKIQDRSIKGNKNISEYDFCMIGYMTDWREQQISKLKAQNYHIFSHRRMLSGRRRDGYFAHSKIVLNIPQWPQWRWLSPMRILAALRTGRFCLNIFEDDLESIDGGHAENFSAIMSIDEILSGKADPILENPDVYFQNAIDAYHYYMQSDANPSFPHEAVLKWAQAEKI